MTVICSLIFVTMTKHIGPAINLNIRRQSWDSKNKKWFHQCSGQENPLHDWPRWTCNAQNWNTLCFRCHNTDLQKKCDFISDAYHTAYGVSKATCESCHRATKNILITLMV